jgi:type I restriction enzyme S subunit
MDMLLENFKVIFDRPEKIKKLRDLILQLSIRGKVVEQNESDEPVSILLEQITQEKDKLIKEGKIKKGDSLLPIAEDEIPYELPKGWEWARLGSLITLRGGKRVPKGYELKTEPTEHIYIRITDMKNGKIVDADLRYIDDVVYQQIKNYIITEKDLYITIAGTIGQVGVVPVKFHNMNLTENAARITPHLVDKTWLRYFICSPDIQSALLDKTNQMAQPKLALKRIQETIIPVPTLNEQRRIVERVDQLMLLCDELEKELHMKVSYAAKSSKSAFGSLSSYVSLAELEKSLCFIIDNFKELSLADNAIYSLKNAILQIAVQGKLVSQDPNDEPASILLGKIRKESEFLILDGKQKKAKQLLPIAEDEIPYNLPNGWEWVRLGTLVDERDITYGVVVPGKEEPADGVPMLRCSDVKYRYIDKNKVRTVEKSISDKYKRTVLKGGEILINVRGTLGGCAIVTNDLIGFNIAREVALIPIIKSINEKYILDVISSPLIQQNVFDRLRGIAYKGLNLNLLENFAIPLPPLKEQNRIVEKVSQLMSLCDELEKDIEQSKNNSELLIQSVLHEAFKKGV